MENTNAGPLVENTDDPTTEHPTDTETSVDDAKPRPRRRAMWITIAVVAIATASIGTYLTVQAVQHTQAVDEFNTTIADRTVAYEAQDKAIEQLHAAQDAAAAEYPQLLAIANTLTDSTVADPATRSDLLTKAGDLVDAAQLSVDDAGAILEEQPYIFKAIAPDTDLPVKGLKPTGDTAQLQAQTAELQSDQKSIESYTRFITALEEGIGNAETAAAGSTTAALTSAAEKGATLTWEKAPAETAAVAAAAAALTADGAADLSLEERAALVQAYITAVNAAGAAHQAVLDQEAADAARQAEEQQQQNGSRSNSGSRSNGSWNNGSTNPGGGTNPGSNWQPLKVNVTGSTCSGSGSKVTYGSTLNIPGTNLDTYNTYEIPGYGWGANWTCSYW